MKKLFLLLTLLIATSCGNKYQQKIYAKQYDYIKEGYVTKVLDDKKFYAKTDSIAYMEVYQYYYILEKVYLDSYKANELKYTGPEFLEFKIINSDGIDISKTVTFQKKDSLEKDTYKRIYSSTN